MRKDKRAAQMSLGGSGIEHGVATA